MTLWCDGLRAPCGRSAKKSDERQECVEKTMKQLQLMHDKKYT